ncbi:MAG: VWA domain-containing protein [Clostridiales bacterium]|jgi:Ca-activated chloride channel family protein|nr:VWA domain-containing protein [Clostridiales bacterium]
MMIRPSKVVIVIVLAVLVFGGTFLIVNWTQNVGLTSSEISEERAVSDMDRLYKRVRVYELEPVKENVDLRPVDVAESLPSIDKYPPQVDNTTPDYVEIFSSTEKATVNTSGQDMDRWLVDIAEQFNREGLLVNGKPASALIRGIASGAAMDYITSGKYVPDAFTPSNELWGDSLTALGVNAKLAERRLAGNVAGIVLTNAKHDEMIQKYGSVSLNTVIEAVASGDVIMGYTNPFASSAGVNFLMSTLFTFDSANPLSDTATSAFERFQTNIPFVAYTTLQMKESAQSGVLDGFVFESQLFANSADLKKEYVFTPFGVRHDSPIYALGDLSAQKQEILRMFIDYCLTDDAQQLASKYGFNQYDDYRPEINAVGNVVGQAQKLWKEKKSGNREVVAVFVADTSGSMDGEPMLNLKQSLLTGANLISTDSSIGMVTFSDDVNIALPIAKFDLNQRSLFTGAVRNMSTNGGTAMFDAIVVAEKMLYDAKAQYPNAKLMLFVMTDGETNQGSSFKDTKDVIAGLKIPVYTIGYNADISVLQQISSLNEAANINADTEDVVYKIQNLFNAEM